jgi:Xaa-Pro aminopeptidase
VAVSDPAALPARGPKLALTEFRHRRSELAGLLDDNSIAILPAARLVGRNSDVDHLFRQDSDFYYLTGFREPDAVFVLVPGRPHGESILFCRERDPHLERWHGHITGPERAMQLHGLDDAFPITDMDDILPGLIEGRERLYYSMGQDREFDSRLIDWINGRKGNGQSGTRPPGELTQLGQYLHELRLFKSAAELKMMKHAAKITTAGHKRIMKMTRPGVMEYQLEAELQHTFGMAGARVPAYPSIVGSGANATILHYVDNDAEMAAGDLVLVDAGSEYGYYASDVTRTFPVSGSFTDAQKQLYNIVLDAELAAIAEVRPGNLWNKPHETAVRWLTRGMLALGILQGELESLIADEAYKSFYMHKTGHWLGLDVHDVGEYQIGGEWRVFEPGMVTTVEPGIYIDADADVPAEFRGIGIRIEDDVLVTRDGHEILTPAIPKTIPEIEAFMAGDG